MKKNSLARKFISSMMAGLTTIALLLVLGNSGSLWWFPPKIVFALVGICLLVAFVFPLIWQYRERQERNNTQKIEGWLNTIIRYTIAFNVAGFGWKKLLGLQFIVPASIAGQPMNQQSGEWLTWFYFGYSHSFGTFLAIIQLVGAYGLLFRKTMLAAAFGLFAFLLNLTLINICYHMNAGALTQSVLLTSGIIYLLLTDYKRLTHFFFHTLPSVAHPDIHNAGIKNILRISAIALSLLFTVYLKTLIK